MGKMKDLAIDLQEQESSQQETGISVQLSTLLTCNSDYRKTFAQSVVNEVAEGNADAQQVLITAKKGIEIFTMIEKNVKPYVSSKSIQKGGYTAHGATLTEKKDPDKYDFSVCKDSYYDHLCLEIEILKAKIKLREGFLKTLTKPLTETEGDYAGEVINPPLITYGAQNVAVSLAK